MDLRLSPDIQESFRIFQSRILEQYLAMSTEFDFTVVDANRLVEEQQSVLRRIITSTIELNDFRSERTPS